MSERALSLDVHLNGFVAVVGWPVEGYLNLYCLPVGLLNTRASVKSSFICNAPCKPVEQIRMHLNPSDKMMNRSCHLDPSPSSSPLASFKDKFEFPASQDFWPTFSFPTPPTSPVEFCSNCQEVTKEMRWHAASGPWGELGEISDDELEVDDVPFELARELCGPRAKSPAILNDIMWSGDRVRRPDSTTDFEARFSLSSTPTHFEQPISHTFVEPEELFSFSLLSHCHDQPDDMLERLENDVAAFDIPIEEHSSDTGIH